MKAVTLKPHLKSQSIILQLVMTDAIGSGLRDPVFRRVYKPISDLPLDVSCWVRDTVRE